MRSMKQSGRISVVMLLSLVSLVLVVGIVLFSRESVASVGGRFLNALERHDVDELTKLSSMSGLTNEQIHKKWDQTVNVAGRYFLFAYHDEGANQASDTTASVRARIIKDADKPAAYDEAMELPMVKVGNEWKVDVRGLSHELYPGLPR